MQNALTHYDYNNQNIALIGYGVTGKACAQFLLNKGAKLSVFDKEVHSKGVESFSKPGLRFYSLNENTQLDAFDLVVVSPGVNLRQTFIQSYLKSGKKVVGDIELFARENTTPVIAVTGSNGKSTVVDMLTQALTAVGLKVGLGGNFGTSALEMLDQELDYIVLELSSFQLESTYSLQPLVSCILNISPDHLDRHGTMQEYTRAKQVIYQHAKHIIFNREDKLSYPPNGQDSTASSFGISRPILTHAQVDKLHYYQTQDGIFLGDELVLASNMLARSNKYQLLNMQVVLACCKILSIDTKKVLNSLIEYKGLAHRFEQVHQTQTCTWINDSKATNPGATAAALSALPAQHSAIVLIAGGDGKGADMSELKILIAKRVSFLVLIGKDKHLFTDIDVPYQLATDLYHAVAIANEQAHNIAVNEGKHATVLLSPACASIDMYRNYEHRGEEFVKSVHKVVAA